MDTYHLVKLACCVKGCLGTVWVDAYPEKRRGFIHWHLGIEETSCWHLTENENDPELYDRVVGQMQDAEWDNECST